MPGRPDFSQAGTAGGGQTVAVTNRPEVEKLSASNTGSLAAGTKETVEFYAPTGSLYRVKNVDILAIAYANATSGTHRFTINTVGTMTATYGESTYSNPVRAATGIWREANNDQAPTTESAVQGSLGSLVGTENVPIKVIYQNDTDAARDRERRYDLIVLEESY